ATKRWPIAHWAALAERLRAGGYRAAVVGGPEDRGLAQQPVAGGAAASAAGEFSLQETGALLQCARVVVSGDTGIMHMATGVGTPVVALFGPTVAQFGFFPYVAPSEVLERELDCRPCSATGTAACPLGHHRCLADITPADVAAAARQHLEPATPAAAAMVLSQLVAPAREVLGTEAGDAIAVAARAARLHL